MKDINTQFGFYGTIKTVFDDMATKNIWDVMVKRLVGLYPEKTENEIIELLNSKAGRHLADTILDIPEPKSIGMAMIRVAMMHRLKLLDFWNYYTGEELKQEPIDKNLLYKAAIHYEMRKPKVQKLIREVIGCDKDTIYDTPGKWINSEYTTVKELETMWGFIQERITKRKKHGYDKDIRKETGSC